MKKSTYNLPVRLFLDSQKTITKYEHLSLSLLNQLTEEEILNTISQFTFDELDERFATFETVFYFVHLEVTFDDEGRSILSELHNIDFLYGKTIPEIQKILS